MIFLIWLLKFSLTFASLIFLKHLTNLYKTLAFTPKVIQLNEITEILIYLFQYHSPLLIFQQFISPALSNKTMNSLKAALGKEDRNIDKMTSNMSVSRKKFSNSKSESMWAFEMQEKDMEVSLDSDKKLQLINNLLKSAFDKDTKLSNNTFDRVVQDFQQGLGTSSNKSEISYYLVLEDKITDLIDLYSKKKGQKNDFLYYIEEFHQNVEERIALLRSKDKKDTLKSFDKIADIHTFKKKAEFLDVGGIKVDLSVKSKQKSNPSNTSNEKKLNRLLSKQKNLKQKPSLKSQKHQEHDDYLLSQTMVQSNQSVSYSAIMSTSVAVKQRRPRKKSGKYEDYFMGKTQQKEKKSVQNEEEHDKTDKAFIFFRPKKGGKN